jgi:hypothetical protein
MLPEVKVLSEASQLLLVAEGVVAFAELTLLVGAAWFGPVISASTLRNASSTRHLLPGWIRSLPYLGVGPSQVVGIDCFAVSFVLPLICLALSVTRCLVFFASSFLPHNFFEIGIGLSLPY